ncbi:MAG: glycosyltransferase [Candidatus Moranbacteria bacterium]|nr:glycosyltransferase [Candidatus Moranbacteria bacterium]
MKCPICRNECKILFEDGKDYFILDGNSPSFGIAYCNDCEIGISTPFLSDEELSSYYPDEYEAYKPKKSFAAFLQTKKYRGDLKIILKNTSYNNSTLFEIGSGRGEFLNEAKKIGFIVEGIEPGKSGIEFAKNNFNIDLQNGFASGIKYNKKYNIIVGRHVLEHINDFNKCLTDIFQNGLDDSGLLFIKIPRFDSWEARFFGKFCSGFDLPRHRVHFTKRGVKKLLFRVGFENIKILNEVVPSDIIRGLQYYSKHGSNSFLILGAKTFNMFPYIMKLFFAQITGIFLSPLGTGRMIIVAGKKQTSQSHLTKTIIAIARKEENKPDGKAAVIIANWNGKEYLNDCLFSLRHQTYKNFKIILVDNGSSDDSVSFVKSNFPEIEIISLPENQGFAKANNIGINKAFEDTSVDYIVTLNNDTRVDPGYIEKMIECAVRHPDAGSIQPKVMNFFNPQMIDSTGIEIYFDTSAINRGQKEKDIGQYEKEEEIFGSSASAGLFARHALEKVKLSENEFFDESYFSYQEDVDLAWRLRLAGFKSYYCPEAKVFHAHSATGKSYSSFKAFFIVRNQYYNIVKNLPFWILIKAFLFLFVHYIFSFFGIFIQKGQIYEFRKTREREGIIKLLLKSWRDVGRNLPKLIERRRLIKKIKQVRNKEINKWFNKFKASLIKIALDK